MFSSSVAGGTVCFGCQLRAVTRRAAPVLAAAAHAQTIHTSCTTRRRQHGSEAVWEGGAEDQLVAALKQQALHESSHSRPAPRRTEPQDDWDLPSSGKRRGDTLSGTKSEGDVATILEQKAHRSRSRSRPPLASRRIEPQDDWDLAPSGKRREDAFGSTQSEVDVAAILEQQANHYRPRPHHAYGRTEPQDDWELPPSSKQQRRLATESAQTEDDTAVSLKQRTHFEAVRPHHANRRRVSRDDSNLPAEELEYTRHDAGQNTTKDDWDLVDNQDAKKPAYSRWGTPPPEAFEDEEGGAQERETWFRRVSTKDPYAVTDENLMGELAKYREPKQYRKGRTKLIEDMSKLSIDTLGREAEVIVLREGGEWFSRPFKEDERPSDPGLSLDDHVDQDEGLSLDDIMENIDELRPGHVMLPLSEFKKIYDSLLAGFTSYQLENYVERHRSRLEEGEETPFLGMRPEVYKALPWIREQSFWTPEVKDAVQEVDQALKGYILKSMRPKQRLAMQLMRECWGVSAQELMDGQGVLEVRIQDMEFKLLTLGAQRWLQTISRVHLSQGGGKAIQAIKSRSSIRILAPKVVAEACLSALNETIQKKRTKAFKIDKIRSSHLDTSMLEELGRITNSVVKFNKKRQEVEVTWIDVRNDPESKLEDVADVVFRLLLTAYPSARADTALTVYPEMEGKGRLVQDIGSSDKLSWMDRRRKWARLCLPMGSQPPRVDTSWPFDQASAMKYAVQPTEEDLDPPTLTIPPPNKSFFSSLAGAPLTFPKPPIVPERKEEKQIQRTPSGWLPFRVRTKAVFGHVLNVFDAVLPRSIHEGTDVLSTSPRTLAPLMPPINELNLPSWVPYNNPHYMTCMVLMRFQPYAVDPARPVDPLAPHLELRLKATDEEIIEVHSLRAVAHTYVSDIVLPAERVDVRITQNVVAEVLGAQIDAIDGLQPLLQFLRDAKFELAKGRLVTPPRLHDLGLPRWMFYRPEADPASPFLPRALQHKLAQKNKDASAGDAADSKADAAAPYDSDEALPPYAEQHDAPAFNALRPASYAFAGLELQRPLETTYDGWRLEYTSVEAGQGGGRRAELALEAVPGGDKEVRRDATDIDAQRFIRSVYKLARGSETNVAVRPSDGTEVKSRIGWIGKPPKSY